MDERKQWVYKNTAGLVIKINQDDEDFYQLKYYDSCENVSCNFSRSFFGIFVQRILINFILAYIIFNLFTCKKFMEFNEIEDVL